jgi:hypothetical protein
MFVIMPTFVIWRLSRSFLERLLISILMGCGLMALGVSILKIYYLRTFNLGSTDNLRTMDEFLWVRVQEMVLVIAVNAPFIKTPIERLLGLEGAPQFQYVARDLDWLRPLDLATSNEKGDTADGGHHWRLP